MSFCSLLDGVCLSGNKRITYLLTYLRDEDGGHAIRSAIAENPVLHSNFTALCVIEADLVPIEVLHCRIGGPPHTFFFAPVTLTLTLTH